MNENDKEAYSINDIFRMIETQTFVNWNECDFESYVTNDNGCKTQEELKDDLRKLLK